MKLGPASLSLPPPSNSSELGLFPIQLTSFFRASRMSVLSWPKLSLILARRRFSMIGLDDWGGGEGKGH